MENIWREHRMRLEALGVTIPARLSEFRLFERRMSEFTESLSLAGI